MLEFGAANSWRIRHFAADRTNRSTFAVRGEMERYSAASRGNPMIRKLPSGKYRLYSRKKNPKTGRRRNLGTFTSRAAAEKHERAVQYFKRH
jgi:hypothetical protein